jgi:hypothetical protein
VRRQVIHDDDVAWRQGGQQALPDVFDKDRAGHRAIDDKGRGDRVVAQPGDEGHCLPMAPRHAADDPVAARRTAAQPGHIGGSAGFVDEDQPGRIESGLIRFPGDTRFGDVRPLLLGGVHDFF